MCDHALRILSQRIHQKYYNFIKKNMVEIVVYTTPTLKRKYVSFGKFKM